MLLLHAEGDLLILDVDYFIGSPGAHLAWLSLSDVQQRGLLLNEAAASGLFKMRLRALRCSLPLELVENAPVEVVVVETELFKNGGRWTFAAALAGSIVDYVGQTMDSIGDCAASCLPFADGCTPLLGQFEVAVVLEARRCPTEQLN